MACYISLTWLVLNYYTCKSWCLLLTRLTFLALKLQVLILNLSGTRNNHWCCPSPSYARPPIYNFDDCARKGRGYREETSSSGNHAVVLEQGKWKMLKCGNKSTEVRRSHLTVSSTWLTTVPCSQRVTSLSNVKVGSIWPWTLPSTNTVV